MSDDHIHDDLKSLANGINLAIASMNKGKTLDFMLIVVTPNDDDTVTLNTITGIMEPAKVRQIGEHLIDMATAQEPSLDPDNDSDIRGHA